MAYHAFVERGVKRNTFGQLSEGDYGSSVREMPQSLYHCFPGDHALGGVRRTPEGMRRWFGRLYRIFPDLRFEVERVLVRGRRWDTTVAIEWTDRAVPSDGVPYENEGAHVVRLPGAGSSTWTPERSPRCATGPQAATVWKRPPLPRRAIGTADAGAGAKRRPALKESMETTHEAVRLGASQKDRAAAVFARAFQDDPVQRYVIPDDARRARLLPWGFDTVVRYCFPYGEVLTTPDLGGVACWMPPGSSTTDFWGMLRSGMILASLRLGPAAFGRMVGITAYMGAERKRLAPVPHWYLFGIGVEPSRQGQGVGGALLAPVLARADAEGLPCYLETQTERNVRFYEKHGFAVASVGEPRGLRVWTMLRTPRPPVPDRKREETSFRGKKNTHTKEER